MQGWGEMLAYHERYQDRLREAEKQRVVQQMLAGDGKGKRWYHQTATWLGRRLITWGSNLLQRYGPAPTSRGAQTSNPHPVDQCLAVPCRE
jgi:hypothetical protein